jgi:hypothetical protein
MVSLNDGSSAQKTAYDITTSPAKTTTATCLSLGGVYMRKEEFFERLQSGKWPDKPVVDDNLDFRNSFLIPSLPENLTVHGFLDLEKIKIKSLPNNLTVWGYLDIRYTLIKTLPENLYVQDFLCLYGTKVNNLPGTLKILGRLIVPVTFFNKVPPEDLPLMIGYDFYNKNESINMNKIFEKKLKSL